MVPLTEQQRFVRDSIHDICEDFDAAYWREKDVAGVFTTEFVDSLAENEWFGGLIPEEYGGFGVAPEYDVERYFREARLTRLIPITQELTLNYIGENVPNPRHSN